MRHSTYTVTYGTFNTVTYCLSVTRREQSLYKVHNNVEIFSNHTYGVCIFLTPNLAVVSLDIHAELVR